MTKPVPALRWNRPGILSKKKPEYFAFEDLPDPATDTEMALKHIHLRFHESGWINLGTDYEAARRTLTDDEESDLRNENYQLAQQIELLLDMNTNYELKKARLRQKLEKLVHQIEHFPGLDSESE
jgi:hypothetical protein